MGFALLLLIKKNRLQAVHCKAGLQPKLLSTWLLQQVCQQMGWQTSAIWQHEWQARIRQSTQQQMLQQNSTSSWQPSSQSAAVLLIQQPKPNRQLAEKLSFGAFNAVLIRTTVS